MDRRYLEWHGSQWRVQVKVPEKARAILGKHRLVVPLHTNSLANANRLKHRVIADLKERIARAEVEARRNARNGGDGFIEEALAWRAELEAGSGDPEDVTSLVLHDRAEEIEKADGRERAAYFSRVAHGVDTPIITFVDTWLSERFDMKPRQRIDYRRALAKFVSWLDTAKLSASIEAAGRKTAGRYVSEAFVARQVHWRTANKDISALSGYWKWLVKKGHCDANIWANQSLPKVKAKSDSQRPKRPFTDKEVATLLVGLSDPLLVDASLIAALSGMRVEEIARLQVRDCNNGAFCIRDAKTSAGIRDVPIHPDLRMRVAHRTFGKPDDAYLFHEMKDPAPGSAVERGQAITKKFVAARRQLGVDERVDGSRQSRIDFHSFRRWFIAKARDALQHGASGFDQWTIADVVGHDREATSAGLGMTMGRYPGGASLKAKTACVVAVKLPKALSTRRESSRKVHSRS